MGVQAGVGFSGVVTMTKLMMQIHNDQGEIVYREPWPAEIDAATSDKLKRYAQVGAAAEALMFANGGFSAWHSRINDGVQIFHIEDIIGEGADLAEALKDATKEGWLG